MIAKVGDYTVKVYGERSEYLLHQLQTNENCYAEVRNVEFHGEIYRQLWCRGEFYGKIGFIK